MIVNSPKVRVPHHSGVSDSKLTIRSGVSPRDFSAAERLVHRAEEETKEPACWQSEGGRFFVLQVLMRIVPIDGAQLPSKPSSH
jgi:hypothetical protein